MNDHGPALKLHRKLNQRKILSDMRFMDAAGLNVHCPRRVQTDNAVGEGKEVVRYIEVSIYLSMCKGDSKWADLEDSSTTTSSRSSASQTTIVITVLSCLIL